jgi:hypothetical protein
MSILRAVVVGVGLGGDRHRGIGHPPSFCVRIVRHFVDECARLEHGPCAGWLRWVETGDAPVMNNACRQRR